MEFWTDPLALVVGACAVAIVLTYGVSLITRNYSQVDRLWSVLPVLYVAVFAADLGFSDTRLNIMAVLVAAWGARLTFNFWRKGGYARGGEDYRWPLLRERMGARKFQMFNATFIAPYQNILLLLISLPADVAWRHAGASWGTVDLAATLVFCAALILETVADQQQWRFHQAKRAALAKGERLALPFLTTGLFRYARHPNYFFEQLQWVCIYALGASAAGTVWNFGLVGPVLLVLLFQGSAAFTEKISLSKYPDYAGYQRTTSRQLPLLPRTPKTAAG
ncbi:MAG: DUF1295 domain-containing protein [Myxococcaceae bacterium]